MQLDAINDAFVEARDEIEYAQEVRMPSMTTMHVLYRVGYSRISLSRYAMQIWLVAGAQSLLTVPESLGAHALVLSALLAQL